MIELIAYFRGTKVRGQKNIVIPGELQWLARPESSEFKYIWIPASAGMTATNT